MIIFGYKGIKSPEFRKISSIEEIAMADNASVVWFDGKIDEEYYLSHHCLENAIKYAVMVDNITDFVLYASLGAAYALIDGPAQVQQQIAESYLFDMKVLCVIDSKNEIEQLAKMGIDGVIFREILE